MDTEKNTNSNSEQNKQNDSYRSAEKIISGINDIKKFRNNVNEFHKKIIESRKNIVESRKNINNTIREAAQTLNKAYTVRAKKIPVVPDKVLVDTLYDKVNGLANIPIGYSITTKEPFFYDFQINPFTIVLTSAMNDDRMSFIYALIKLFQKVEGTSVKVVDFVDAYEKEIFGVESYKDNFDQAMVTINNDVLKNKDSNNKTIYIILGAGEMKDKLGPNGKQVVNNLFTGISSVTNAKFILIDVMVSFKNIQIEPWYQGMVDNSYGIWLDNDAANQLVINVPNITMDDRKINFPYIEFSVSKGRHTIIKHMMDEEEEEHEE